MNSGAISLVTAGLCILIGSLFLLRQIVDRVPAESRRNWYFVTVLTLLFIAGYCGYLIKFWSQHEQLTDLLVPTILFLGACFVLMTYRIALQTLKDLSRIALLEQESMTDSLTGIYNRRYVTRRSAEEFARAKRYNIPLSILILDIDNFKTLNDTHGHTTGDMVLIGVGRLIHNRIRASDIAARYGGDEFIIIAPNTAALSDGRQTHDPVQAHLLAEQLRHSVENELAMPISRLQQGNNVTVSIGVAEVTHDTHNADAVIDNADRALYQAKQAGRNRVVIFDGMVAN